MDQVELGKDWGRREVGGENTQDSWRRKLSIDSVLIVFSSLPSVSISVFIQGLGLGVNHTGTAVSSLGFTSTHVHRIAHWCAGLGRFSLVLVSSISKRPRRVLVQCRLPGWWLDHVPLPWRC